MADCPSGNAGHAGAHPCGRNYGDQHSAYHVRYLAPMASIRAVCFDIGGVLVEVGVTWSDAMKAAGMTPPRQADSHYEGLDAFKLFQAGQLDIEAYLDELADFLGIDAQAALKVHEHILLRITEGTLEIVQRAEFKEGIVTGCLSNTNTLHWQVMLRQEEFPNIAALQHKVASQIIGFNKPAPESYRAFEAAVGAKGAEIVYFEDSPANVKGGDAAGWHAVLIDPKVNQERQIREALSSHNVLS